MASNIPTTLKSADITRFAIRAAQVERAKPVVAYWCNYWIVNQILSKGLHNSDDESMTYTMTLMDKLEQTKAEQRQNDAVIDDVTGQAYIEQFGLETFQRADNAVKANKASKQTTDTFQAAATFLELLHIWGPIDAEIASKIKFAKYHALRIAKALKAGEDPNLSNPTPEPSPSQEQPPLNPNDPDVQAIKESGSSQQHVRSSRQPSIEEIPDEYDRLLQHQSQNCTFNESLHPSKARSLPRSSAPDHGAGHVPPSPQEMDGDYYYHNAPAGGVSPIESSAMNRASSEGGGYFPKAPNLVGAESPGLPVVPSQHPGSPPFMDLPDTFSLPAASSGVDSSNGQQDRISPVPRDSDLPLHIDRADVQHYPSAPSRHSYLAQPPSAPSFVPQAPPRTSRPASTVPASQRVSAQPTLSRREISQVKYVADEEAILKAQKHAKWAISALNFEDVSTAVLELQGALQALGA
ncbi:hypothetical protein MMC06_002906 [Schaereria dolodes]|nr:hypothetical protein [Schaereria dolodes]